MSTVIDMSTRRDRDQARGWRGQDALTTLRLGRQQPVPYGEFALVGFESDGTTSAVQCDTGQLVEAIETLVSRAIIELQHIPRGERALVIRRLKEVGYDISRATTEGTW